MGRIRLTALVTASAVALGAVTTPSALAAPTTEVVTSAHGQLLCEVAPTQADLNAGEALEAAYRETIQTAALKIQARYPGAEEAFAKATSIFNITDINLIAAIASMTGAGYNNADLALIVIGGAHPELVVQDSQTSLLPTTRVSLARAKTQLANAQGETGTRAPLLSEGTQFSQKFRAELKEAEAATKLQASIDLFEAQASHAIMADAWEDCVNKLEAAGAAEGSTPLPEIEYTVPAPNQNGGSSAGGSSIDQSAVVGLGIVAAIIAAGVGFVAMNGGIPGLKIGGYSAPILKLPVVPVR